MSALLKCDVNRGSLLLMIFVGRPNHRYTLSRYNWAIPGPVIIVSQGRNTAALEHPWSTMVKIAFLPLWVGSPVIKSIATRWNGRALSSVGMRYRGIFRLCVRFLAC